MNSQIIETAMSIILHSGKAKATIDEVVNLFANKEYEAVDVKLKEAEEHVRQAHLCQTQIIQNEARGEKQEFSLLFIHAQDTLMTVMSELNITKNMIKLLKSL